MSEAIEQLPTRERDSFVALVLPIISMQLSRLSGVEQLESITANQSERLRDLASLGKSLREQLQNNRNEMSHLEDILVRFGISPNEEE